MLVHFYGKLGDRLGRAVEIDLPAGVTTVAELRACLASAYPNFAADLFGRSLRACVDDQIVSEDHAVKGCKIVEFFPPLSGG